MIRSITSTLAFLSVVSFSAANAELYMWKDAQGTTHFTEDLGKVPKKLRKNVRNLEADDSSSPAPSTPSASAATGAEKVGNSAPPPVSDKVETATDQLYAGKSYEQWKKEFSDREASMGEVRTRAEEIAVQVKSPALKIGEQQRLLSEHATLIKQFNEMKEQYHQQVEIARKAGLQINLQ